MKLLISLCIVTLFAFGTVAAQQAGAPTSPSSLEAELISLTNQWTSAILCADKSRASTGGKLKPKRQLRADAEPHA
jgi:hypothetical protein